MQPYPVCENNCDHPTICIDTGACRCVQSDACIFAEPSLYGRTGIYRPAYLPQMPLPKLHFFDISRATWSVEGECANSSFSPDTTEDYMASHLKAMSTPLEEADTILFILHTHDCNGIPFAHHINTETLSFLDQVATSFIKSESRHPWNNSYRYGLSCPPPPSLIAN